MMGATSSVTIEQRTLRVTEATEAAGFARCVTDDVPRPFVCDLYVAAQALAEIDPRQRSVGGGDPASSAGGAGGEALRGIDRGARPGALVRLQVGDVVVGGVRGASVVEIKRVEPARPPAALLASLTRLDDQLQRFGLGLPRPLDRFAERVWRFNHRQPVDAATATVRGAVRAQLAFLFHGNVHPFDDRDLVLRMSDAMRRYGAAFPAVERLDRDGDVRGFQMAGSNRLIPFSKRGDWEQPAACYEPLVERANAALEAAGAAARWYPIRQDFVLVPLELLQLLVGDAIVERG